MSERRDTRQVDLSEVQRLARESMRPEAELAAEPLTLHVVGKCVRGAEKAVRAAGLEPVVVEEMPETVTKSGIVLLRQEGGEVVEAKTA